MVDDSGRKTNSESMLKDIEIEPASNYEGVRAGHDICAALEAVLEVRSHCLLHSFNINMRHTTSVFSGRLINSRAFEHTIQ